MNVRIEIDEVNGKSFTIELSNDKYDLIRSLLLECRK